MGMVEELRREHELIARVLAEVETLAERLRRGEEVPAPTVSGALDFFAAFVGRYHGAKEEQGLFPVLAECGVDAASLAALTARHEEGRRLLAALRSATTRGRLGAKGIALLEAYVVLLRRCVADEERTVFPLVDRVISGAGRARVQHAFDEVERALGPAGRDALLALARAVTYACRAIGANGKGTRAEMLARHVVRPRRVAVAPGDSLARAADLMESLGTRELPVVEGDVLVGILGQSDLQPHRGHYEWTAVRAAMTPDPVTVGPETPIRAVARLLLERSFNAVPVTVGKVLVGMVARSDLLRLLAEEAPAGRNGEAHPVALAQRPAAS
jgi:CBS domain-containing protein